MTQNQCTNRAFALSEKQAFLAVSLICLIFLFSFLSGPLRVFPVRKEYQSGCASNMKQIGLAFLAYAEDNDGRLPPVLGTVRLVDGKPYEQQWGLTTRAAVAGRETLIPGLLSPFIRNEQIFHCGLIKRPDTERHNWPNTGLNYMYNDLAADQALSGMPQPDYSILIAEADHRLRNVGHAKSGDSSGKAAQLVPKQEGSFPRLLIGAAIGDGSIRHKAGANYCFVDGHVTWMKPDVVFFPARTSNSSSHHDARTGRIIGPDPKGTSQRSRIFLGRLYAATFHMR